jgi:hypothetical protein
LQPASRQFLCSACRLHPYRYSTSHAPAARAGVAQCAKTPVVKPRGGARCFTLNPPSLISQTWSKKFQMQYSSTPHQQIKQLTTGVYCTTVHFRPLWLRQSQSRICSQYAPVLPVRLRAERLRWARMTGWSSSLIAAERPRSNCPLPGAHRPSMQMQATPRTSRCPGQSRHPQISYPQTSRGNPPQNHCTHRFSAHQPNPPPTPRSSLSHPRLPDLYTRDAPAFAAVHSTVTHRRLLQRPARTPRSQPSGHDAGPRHRHPRPRAGGGDAGPRAPTAMPRVCGGGRRARRASPRDALDAAGEGGGVPLAGGLGGAVAAAAAQARGGVLAAGGLPPGLLVRDVRARGPRAARPRRGAPRRVLRRARGRHGHGRGAAHVPDHDQHARRRPRRDRRQQLPLGGLDARLDRRGEPPRRHPRQVHVPIRPRRHAHGREDRPVPHRLRHGTYASPSSIYSSWIGSSSSPLHSTPLRILLC